MQPLIGVYRERPIDGAAVLAHEDAHIAGRHHHLLMVLCALAHSLTRLPLFTRGHAAIAELLQMCADDSAARRRGTRPLITGMIALAGPQPSPSGWPSRRPASSCAPTAS